MEYIEGISMGHIAINLGGTYLTKRVPLHLAQGVVSNFPQYTFHLIGGPDVISQKISYSKYPNVIDHIGVSSLSDSIRILSQCELVITGDTGFMHIGAALQKPMITIWGSTSTLFGFAPYYGYQSDVMYHIIEELNLSCRPCSKYGVKSCPIKHMNCLNNITTAKVNSLVENVMNT
jgi:ADP-heptose:LPS heptosyltransferase